MFSEMLAERAKIVLLELSKGDRYRLWRRRNLLITRMIRRRRETRVARDPRRIRREKLTRKPEIMFFLVFEKFQSLKIKAPDAEGNC